LKETQHIGCLGAAVNDIANREDLIPTHQASFVEQGLEFKIASVG
jgi:hypothetical protein